MLQLSKNDECYTETEAIEFLLEFIPKNKIIWECTDFGESKITKVLRKNGFIVKTSHIKNEQDYFNYEPDEWDICITNPPFSIKTQFLKRAFELGKPFMFLLPLTTLEGKARSELYRKHDFSIVVPNKRFEFDYEGKTDGKRANRFATMWMGNMIAGKQMIFKEV